MAQRLPRMGASVLHALSPCEIKVLCCKNPDAVFALISDSPPARLAIPTVQISSAVAASNASLGQTNQALGYCRPRAE